MPIREGPKGYALTHSPLPLSPRLESTKTSLQRHQAGWRRAGEGSGEMSKKIQPKHRCAGSEGEVWRRRFQSRGSNKGKGREVGQACLQQRKRLRVAGGEGRTGRFQVALKAKERAFFFFLNIYLFIYFCLCWVFVSARGLSLVPASGGHSSSRCAGLSLSRPLLLRSTGSRRAGSVIVAHGPSCSAACGILPGQGSNPCPLHWQADSQPLRHQGSPRREL